MQVISLFYSFLPFFLLPQILIHWIISLRVSTVPKERLTELCGAGMFCSLACCRWRVCFGFFHGQDYSRVWHTAGHLPVFAVSSGKYLGLKYFFKTFEGFATNFKQFDPFMLDLLYSKTNIWEWIPAGKTVRLFSLFPLPSSLNEQTHGQVMSSQDALAVTLERRAIMNKVAYWLKRSNKLWLLHSNRNLRVNTD